MFGEDGPPDPVIHSRKGLGALGIIPKPELRWFSGRRFPYQTTTISGVTKNHPNQINKFIPLLTQPWQPLGPLLKVKLLVG